MVVVVVSEWETQPANFIFIFIFNLTSSLLLPLLLLYLPRPLSSLCPARFASLLYPT